MALCRLAKRFGLEQRQVASVALQPDAWKAARRAGLAQDERPERFWALAIVFMPGTTVRVRRARMRLWRGRIVADLLG
jgi:hypothetical protein